MRIRRTLRTAVTSAVMTGVFVLGTGVASASSFLSWEGPQNTGRAKEVFACGCNNIDPNFRAAYRFKHTGQDATMYNQDNCQGQSHFTFHGSQESRDPFGWRSVFFHC
ncbi:hypothetical protein E2C00_00995 [Streptomyces sp. WAC05374]|uniref:MiAMP1 family antimicrobial peptide n=1 Tax=Streptomyces sp. WAC05374 TaxID=2487420 RepID=UPI000F85F39D|nr:MiAMP1 family antimicrobial peptide [Streptomyces sp. WAC05374]RST01143.1 hypothetical protein EF905_35365 [Streptomyces sp. WAC05374]TDF50125.1 hypothetical protein E2B92_00970 [Streptomyces sp. WAC05374]TDF57850.1 hypothetical protein E2C02_08760 [Streptomyces sp. WAC05374]TDF60379.1 hypothetical protein E2C00_00995 [Streptomyces sp. WAC05374]